MNEKSKIRTTYALNALKYLFLKITYRNSCYLHIVTMVKL